MSDLQSRRRLWPWLVGYGLAGLGVGLFSSWYVYRAPLTWITALLFAVFLLGGMVNWRRANGSQAT